MIDYLDDHLFYSDLDIWVLYLLYYDRLDSAKGNDVARNNNSKEFWQY